MENKTCLYCFESIEVKNVSDLQPGMHVRFGRKGIKSVGFLYWHHAIVIDVNKNDEVTLIHFAKVELMRDGFCEKKSRMEILKEKLKAFFSRKVNIAKETKKLNDKTMKNMFIVKHRFSYDHLEAVRRAEDIHQKFQTGNAADLSYNVFTNNCEHLALYCTTGNFSCIQVKDFVDKHFDIMTTSHKILRFLGNLDKYFKVPVTAAKNAGWVVEGAITAGTVITLVAEIYNLKQHFDQGIMCEFCFNSRLVKAVLCMLMSALTCTVFYLIVFLTKGAVIGLIVLSVVSLIITVAVYKGSSVLRHKISPLRKSQKLRIESFGKVKAGDIINFRNYQLSHDAIVVKCSPEREINVGFLEIEEGAVKAKCTTLSVENVSCYNKNKKILVPLRKTTFKSFSKRGFEMKKLKALEDLRYLLLIKKSTLNGFQLSAAFTHDYYIKMCGEIGLYCLSTSELNTLKVNQLEKAVKSLNRIQSMDPYIEHLFPGIKSLSKKIESPTVDEISAAEKELKTLNEGAFKDFLIDFLEKEGVFIRISDCQHLSTTLKRLNQRLQTEEKFWRTVPVENLVPGDLVEVSIEGRTRTAVILDTCSKAKLDIIHYNLDENGSFLNVFLRTSRVVMNETITLDCKKQTVLKHEFDESLVYPPDVVVKRAEELVGERKWKFFSHWSSHFATYCKLRPQGNNDREIQIRNGQDISVDPSNTIRRREQLYLTDE